MNYVNDVKDNVKRLKDTKELIFQYKHGESFHLQYFAHLSTPMLSEKVMLLSIKHLRTFEDIIGIAFIH